MAGSVGTAFAWPTASTPQGAAQMVSPVVLLSAGSSFYLNSEAGSITTKADLLAPSNAPEAITALKSQRTVTVIITQTTIVDSTSLFTPALVTMPRITEGPPVVTSLPKTRYVTITLTTTALPMDAPVVRRSIFARGEPKAAMSTETIVAACLIGLAFFITVCVIGYKQHKGFIRNKKISSDIELGSVENTESPGQRVHNLQPPSQAYRQGLSPAVGEETHGYGRPSYRTHTLSAHGAARSHGWPTNSYQYDFNGDKNRDSASTLDGFTQEEIAAGALTWYLNAEQERTEPSNLIAQARISTVPIYRSLLRQQAQPVRRLPLLRRSRGYQNLNDQWSAIGLSDQSVPVRVQFRSIDWGRRCSVADEIALSSPISPRSHPQH